MSSRFPAWEVISEGRKQQELREVQRGQRSSYMLLVKESVTTNLGGRLLRRFPIWDWSLWFLLKFSSVIMSEHSLFVLKLEKCGI